MSKLIVICMVGAPCSGKSTWIEENQGAIMARHNCSLVIISRDQIRDTLFGKNYKINQSDEKKVTAKFYEQLSTCTTLENAVIILDNTHMFSGYISSYRHTFRPLIDSGKLEFYIEFFKIPYWKAKIRNVKRWLITGKWIPFEAMKDFYDRYDTEELDFVTTKEKYSDKYGT